MILIAYEKKIGRRFYSPKENSALSIYLRYYTKKNVMSNPSANQVGCNGWSWYYNDLRILHTPFAVLLAAFRHSHGLFTDVRLAHEILSVRSVQTKFWISRTHCLAAMRKALVKAQEIDQFDRERQVKTLLYDLSSAYRHCRSYISSRKDHAFREDIFENTQAIAWSIDQGLDQTS